MTKKDLAQAIAAAGLKPARTIPVPEPARNGVCERWVVNNAAVATRRHGIVWVGDLDLDREAYLLQGVALKIDEDPYVVDEAGRDSVSGTGPSRALIREALWWSQVQPLDRDKFLGVRHYEGWHPRTRRYRRPPPPLGKNWESKLLFAEQMPGQDCSDEAEALAGGKAIKPIVLHRSGIYELVWFSNGYAVPQPAFHSIRERCREVPFSVYPGKAAIHVRKQAKLVALLWPLDVPNRETARAGRHELALRILPATRDELA